MEKIKVVMIDDNVNLVNMIKEYFSSHAVIDVVLEAYDGEEGIKVIKERINEYDVILLDLIMPKKDGLSVLDEMKELGINKHVIVVTSYNAQEMIRKISEYGINYFILKPFELSDLEKRKSVVVVNLPEYNLHVSYNKPTKQIVLNLSPFNVDDIYST